ncbi:MAG: hypothetical protein HRT74_08515 [Flavobacteriales bacterium]|nr:hypothetical protein [Flavobacteriales bacterium]
MVLFLGVTAQHWNSLDGGFDCFYNGLVYDIEVKNNSELWVCGAILNDSQCNDKRGPAFWEDGQWNFLDASEGAGGVFKDICFFDGKLYTTMSLDGIFGVYLLDTTSFAWTLITDPDRFITTWDLQVSNDLLHIAGSFDDNLNAEINEDLIMTYDGENLEYLIGDIGSAKVANTSCVYQDTLYVGGSFNDYINDIHSVCQVVPGQVHQPLGEGVGSNSGVFTLEIHEGLMY